jgi:hypothetical protein
MLPSQSIIMRKHGRGSSREADEPQPRDPFDRRQTLGTAYAISRATCFRRHPFSIGGEPSRCKVPTPTDSSMLLNWQGTLRFVT